MELFQLGSGNLVQQAGELVLPLLAVRENGELEWGAVQQYKLDVENRLLGLNIVGHLRVPGIILRIGLNVININPLGRYTKKRHTLLIFT